MLAPIRTRLSSALPRISTSAVWRSQHAAIPAARSTASILPSSSSLASSHATTGSPLASFSARSGPATPHHSPRPTSFASESYSHRTVGEWGTRDWRMFLQRGGKDVSAWHDIPILAQGSNGQQLLFHYVNEIPRGTRPKMELATKEVGSPIKQDVKKGNLRVFTYGDLPFNYGFLPQTWENPYEPHPETRLNGDNDPLDVVELSSAPIAIGQVKAVKIIGVLALLDENETDWKLLAIDAAHPLAAKVNTLADVEAHFPQAMHQVREWFRSYKTTDGKPQNVFGFDEKFLDTGFAQKVIWETHAAWAQLCRGEIPKMELWTPTEVPTAAQGE